MGTGRTWVMGQRTMTHDPCDAFKKMTHLTHWPMTHRPIACSDCTVWGALQQTVYQRRRFTTINQLKQAIVTESGKLLQRFIDRAIGQWRRRLKWIVHSKADKLYIWCKSCSMWVTLDNSRDNKHVNCSLLLISKKCTSPFVSNCLSLNRNLRSNDSGCNAPT